MPLRLAFALALALILGGAVFSAAQSDPAPTDETQPLDSSLVERTERRLIQLDVSLVPKKKKRSDAVIPELSIDDLELVIMGRRIDIRYADRLCSAVDASVATDTAVPAPAPSHDASEERAPAEIPTGRGAYLFYFEHKHLTTLGQETALVMAEELIPQLVGRGTRGMVVSSGRQVLQSELTDDPDYLLSFIDEIRGNVNQWGEMAYAEGEWDRYADIFDQQEPEWKGEPAALVIGRATWRALKYAREERTITSRQLSRFAAVLGSFAELDPPKAALYFADIIRKNPGDHFAALFSEATRGSEARLGSLGQIANMGFVAGVTFDRVTEQAGAHGIRIYTIRARGLEQGVSTVTRSAYMRPNQMSVPDRGARDAAETMVGLAQETGGASFLGGTEKSTLKRVLTRIRSDLSCFYLLSFYPDGLPLDSPLAVRVRFNVDSPRYDELSEPWDLRSRGQLVVQSETRRKESVLFAAHAAPSAADSETGRSVLIPLGFADGEYQVLAQFAVESPELPAVLSSSASWDLGMSLLFREQVRQQVSRRLEVGATSAPVVLEAEWSFPPGPGELVSVGYEHRFGQLASVTQSTDWPDPNGSTASITPIAVVQPASGVFLRVEPESDEQPRYDGPLAIGDGPVQLDRPVYFVVLVCRAKKTRDLWIDRKLVGNVSVDFGLQPWSGDGEERCVQIRDLLRAGQAGWGDFQYVVRVYDEEARIREPVAERVREFSGL